MNEQSIFTILGQYVFEALAALLAALLWLVRWIYVRDSKGLAESIAGIRQDHSKLIDMVNEINATRPHRNEVEEAIEDLRRENATGFSSLRAEIRADITGLRVDMTTRLDTLIRLHSGK